MINLKSLLKMGNVFNCVHKPARKRTTINEEISFDSTTSITNQSQVSSVEPVETISSCSSTLTSPSSKFSWNRMQGVYIVAVESSTKQIIIQPETLSIMENIFTTLENNMGKMSRIFYECMNEMDHSFPTYFEDCAARNPKSLTVGKVLNERISSHTLNMIHLHCKIIGFLETSNKKDALNVMRLVAISHVLMNVQPQSFILLNTVMAKFLLRSGILSEENAEYVVTYFNFITESITNYMRVQITHDLGFHNPNVARENFRNMKNWYAIVSDLHQETDQIRNVESVSLAVEELSQQSPIPTEILKQDACFIKHFVKKKLNIT